MKFDDAYTDRRRAIKYLAIRYSIILLIFWFFLWFLNPLAFWIREGFTREASSFAGSLWAKGLTHPWLVFKWYGEWWYNFFYYEPRHYTWTSFIGWRLLILPTFAFVMAVGYYFLCNPFLYTPQWYGHGREATVNDLPLMKLNRGKYLFLGLLGGKKMKMPDTRSVFCIGATSIGKTTGVVIPNIFEADNACQVIHDPKEELVRLTSGYRATKGPVYVMDFSKVDKPEDGIYYPCWNPLNEDNLPPQGSGRDSYIDSLVSILIPEGPESSDPYWVKAGRGCLTGLSIYLANKVEQALANDYFVARLAKGTLDKDDGEVLLSYYKSMQQTPEVQEAMEALEKGRLSASTYVPVGTWNPIPKSWVGREPSFGMLLDLLNSWMFAKTKEVRTAKESGNFATAIADPWQLILDEMVNETFFYGYSRRALLELNQVLNLPDKQRASVLSMGQMGVEIFKNSAVRSRTSSNDISYKQLRGIKDEKTGEYKPITVYISTGVYENSITTLFVNMISDYLMENGPNEKGVGPYPVEFILDDFSRMPKMQSIADGITFGRSKSNIFLLVVQDWHQISAKYGDETKDVILSSTAAKIIKRQNNIVTRNAMMAGIMPFTRRVDSSHSIQVGFAKDVNPFMGKGGYKRISDSVIGGTGVMNMAPEKQLVLLAGFYHLPIYAKTPLFYKDAKMKKKTQIPPSSPLPDKLKRKRMNEYEGRYSTSSPTAK